MVTSEGMGRAARSNGDRPPSRLDGDDVGLGVDITVSTVVGLLAVQEADLVSHNLNLRTLLAGVGGPLVEPEPAGDGHLAALDQIVAAHLGQSVEGDDIEVVGGLAAGAVHGEAEGGGFVLVADPAGRVSGQAADELAGVE